jgi:hypothetical protein
MARQQAADESRKALAVCREFISTLGDIGAFECCRELWNEWLLGHVCSPFVEK